jgi:prophage DNA circulation protein
MDWRDRLRDATFREVPFHVEATDRDGGNQRTVEHEYPARDLPYVEELGTSARRHTIEAFLLGPDYMQQRDRLLDALARPGQGKLVHPYFGTLSVKISGAMRVRHSTRDGGMVQVGFTAVEDELPLFPETFVNPAAQTARAAEASTIAAAGSFNATAQVEHVPGWVSQNLADEVDAVRQRLLAIDLSGGVIAEVAEFTRLANTLGDLLVDVVRLGGFPDKLRECLAHLEAAYTSHAAAIRAYLDLDMHRAVQTHYGSSVGLQADLNRMAVERLLREQAVAAAVRLAALVAWASHEEALAARDEIAARIDDLMQGAGDDTFPALEDLSAQLTGAVPAPDQTLPHIERVVPAATTSTLLLAYRLYGDVAREAELVARNDPPYPGFLPGGEALEVLVDVA